MKKLISALGGTIAVGLLSFANIAAAQIYGSSTTASSSSGVDTSAGVGGATTGVTPGVPSTGAGGNATLNLIILGFSLAIIIAGIYYLNKKPVVHSDYDLS